jgi:hypothetical protein
LLVFGVDAMRHTHTHTHTHEREHVTSVTTWVRVTMKRRRRGGGGEKDDNRATR